MGAREREVDPRLRRAVALRLQIFMEQNILDYDYYCVDYVEAARHPARHEASAQQ